MLNRINSSIINYIYVNSVVFLTVSGGYSMKMPGHVAIIMDGNGRWAKKKRMPRMVGHKAGVKTIDVIAEVAADLGIKALTLYAFSSENWKKKPRAEFLKKIDFVCRADEFRPKSVKKAAVFPLSTLFFGTKKNHIWDRIWTQKNKGG